MNKLTEIAYIIEYKEQGYGSRWIAQQINRSKSYVNKMYNEYLIEQQTKKFNLEKYGTEYDPYDVAFKYVPEDVVKILDESFDKAVDEFGKEHLAKALVKPKEFNNECILLISDMHIPYHHLDTFEFLEYLKDKYKPTRVICLGDELDKHSLSFHDSDPDLHSAGHELSESLKYIKQLEELFPELDILESNHGSLIWRKAKSSGIPKHYIKTYNEVLGVSDKWEWHFDLTIKLPNGQDCYLHHGKSQDVVKLSQTMGMNAVQGHYHETMKSQYWGNPTNLYWGLQIGCLIDNKSLAFSYNNCNLKRPVVGTGLIINSLPVLEPMVLDHNGRWIGRYGSWQEWVR